jgi:CRISPR/Cas system CSM-associated protein Csm4 (group 5 of RAMP superfamily)
MIPGVTVKLHPTGPWRIGPSNGEAEVVDILYHSDSLYSAVTGAMRDLGELEEWLAATAGNPAGSAVRFTSCFPFLGKEDLITPPRTLWPPAPSAKVRWSGARLVPVSVVRALLNGRPPDEDAWSVDGPSECLVPAGRSGPFRVSIRKSAAVDRLSGVALPHASACVDFQAGAGLWCDVGYANEEARARWQEAVQTAFRYLGDSGFGGKRSRGWGRCEVEFTDDEAGLANAPQGAKTFWMLSLFTPAAGDQIDWQRGNYAVVNRGGRVASPVRSGDEKKIVPMIEEGSVLAAAELPVGSAPDVAPDGFPHPVFRAGFAFAVPMPEPVTA